MHPVEPVPPPSGDPQMREESRASLPTPADHAGSVPLPLPADQPDRNTVSGRELSPRDQRLDGWTPSSKRAFLEALARCGNVKNAAAFVAMSREGAYRLKRRDRAFAFAWEGAMVQARALAEDELQDKAINGITEQLSYHGEVLDTRTRFDGRLLLALLGRLDKRAESDAALLGADRFDDLLDAIEADEDAGDLLETPAQALAREAAQSGATGSAAEDVDRHIIWQEGEEWWTDYPPPPGDYDGIERGAYGRSGYARTLSGEELAGSGLEEEEASDLALAEAQRRAAFGLEVKTPFPPAEGDLGVGASEASSEGSIAESGIEPASAMPTPAPSRKREGESAAALPEKASLDCVTRVTLDAGSGVGCDGTAMGAAMGAAMRTATGGATETRTEPAGRPTIPLP